MLVKVRGTSSVQARHPQVTWARLRLNTFGLKLLLLEFKKCKILVFAFFIVVFRQSKKRFKKKIK